MVVEIHPACALWHLRVPWSWLWVGLVAFSWSSADGSDVPLLTTIVAASIQELAIVRCVVGTTTPMTGRISASHRHLMHQRLTMLEGLSVLFGCLHAFCASSTALCRVKSASDKSFFWAFSLFNPQTNLSLRACSR